MSWGHSMMREQISGKEIDRQMRPRCESCHRELIPDQTVQAYCLAAHEHDGICCDCHLPEETNE